MVGWIHEWGMYGYRGLIVILCVEVLPPTGLLEPLEKKECLIFNISVWPLIFSKGICCWFCSISQLCPILCDRGRQHSRPPCPSPSPEVCPSLCSLLGWWYPTISFSDTFFSFCPQSFSASGTLETKPKSANICSIDEWMVDKLIRKVSICLSYYLSGCREIYLSDFRHTNKRDQLWYNKTILFWNNSKWLLTNYYFISMLCLYH